MTKKWYEVDMNNSKCWALYKKQMKLDLQEMFKYFKETGIQQIIYLTDMIEVLTWENKTVDIDWTDLDLSSYVPDNAIAVYLQIFCKDSFGRPALLLVRKDETFASGAYAVAAHVSNTYNYNHVIVNLTADKKIQCSLRVSSSTFGRIRLFGYVVLNKGGGGE